MSLLTKNLSVVLSVLLFGFTVIADVPAQNAEGRGGVGFGIYDVEKDLTPGGWVVVVGALVLAGYGIFKFAKRRRIK